MKYRLREHVEKSNDTLEDLSKYLGVTYQTLSKKMNQHVDFNNTEMMKIKQRYNLSAEQMDSIFFSEE